MQVILKHQEIEQKITRLAYQILENCTDQQEIFIGGIHGNGYILSQKIQKVINEHGSLKTQLFEIELNKEEPWSSPINVSIPESNLKHGYIVLIDDVINSGKTMQYALIKFLQHPTLS